MQTLIFSDTHLHPYFEPSKAEFLHKIISEADKVIINGDFWDGDLWSFDEFIKSPWNKLFPALIAKNATYIYGNHDPIEKTDERVSLFSTSQQLTLKLKYGKRTFIVTHGDQYDLTFHAWFDRGLGKFLVHFKPFLYGLMLGEEILIRFWDDQISQKKLQRFNEEIKKQMANKDVLNTWLVCGHTHSAELDLKKQFVNSGFVRAGIGQYLTINEAGFVLLHEERY